MAFDWSKLTVPQMEKELENGKNALENKRKSDKAEAKKKLEATAKKLGYSLEEFLQTTKRKTKAKINYILEDGREFSRSTAKEVKSLSAEEKEAANQRAKNKYAV